MNLTEVLKRIDQSTARAFVEAARHVIDALLIEAARIEQTRTPDEVDYRNAELSRRTPPGGWLADGELRRTAQRMAEALAAEKYTDGMTFAIQFFTQLGVL